MVEVKDANIISFQDLEEYSDYINSKRLIRKLGSGSEGVCYLSSKDNHAYKILESSMFEYTGTQHKLEEIITTKDIDLKYFALPEELHAISKRLIGYKAKYVKEDLFDYYNLVKNYENIYKINFNSLKKAYENMLKELEKMDAEKIKIYDLTCNLMFTGKELIAIDTCFYQRVTGNTFDVNCSSLNAAIRNIFNTWIEFNPDMVKDEISFIKYEDDFYEYLKNVSKVTKKVKKRNLM